MSQGRCLEVIELTLYWVLKFMVFEKSWEIIQVKCFNKNLFKYCKICSKPVGLFMLSVTETYRQGCDTEIKLPQN